MRFISPLALGMTEFLRKKQKLLETKMRPKSSHQIHHLILLAKDMKGYENLCALLSKAYLEGFYYKPRIDMDLLREYSEGLVCTTACLKGEVGYNFSLARTKELLARLKNCMIFLEMIFIWRFKRTVFLSSVQ